MKVLYTCNDNVFHTQYAQIAISCLQPRLQSALSWHASRNRVFRAGTGIATANGNAFSDSDISGCGIGVRGSQSSGTLFSVGRIYSSQYGVQLGNSISEAGDFLVEGTSIGAFAGTSYPVYPVGEGMSVTLKDCLLQSGTQASATPAGMVVREYNKNGDAAIQEIYTRHSGTTPAIQRNSTTTNRSTSSAEMTMNTTTAIEWSFDVLAKAGQTIRLMCYVRKNASYGSSTLPSLTVSGLGITPVTQAMSSGTAADTWELLTLDATNNGASDGLLTVTMTGQSSTAGAKCFFSGLPVAPFVSRCRHYGYEFDETNPVRTINITTAASEAVAAAYAGITVSWGASSYISAIAANRTLQELYDYTQAHGCLNVGSSMPLTGAGVSGSPALFAAGNITVSDGYVLNGAGSLSMGGNLLSTEFSGGANYTYTGGTWSQLTTVPTFSGGQVNLGAAGTYVFGVASDTILSMTPAAASSYNMGGLSVTGTLDLRNTTAHAINVALPVGTSYTTANNPGGAITVTTPPVTVTVTVLDDSTGSPIQDAHVYLCKVADKSQVLNSATDIDGVAQSNYAFSIDTPVMGWARQMDLSGTDYEQEDISGTITSSGLDVSVRLTPI